MGNLREQQIEAELNALQPGLAELYDYMGRGNSKTCKVKADNDFYFFGDNRDRYLLDNAINYFG